MVAEAYGKDESELTEYKSLYFLWGYVFMLYQGFK